MNSLALELSNVRWQVSGKRLLDNINLQIPLGSCCVILGPNGSGKSSLMAILSGYIWPSQGHVQILDNQLGKVPIQEVRNAMGIVEPSRCPAFPYQYSTQEVVATGLFSTLMLPLGRDLEDYEWQQVDQELAELGLSKCSNRPFLSLSSGEKMKTLLARALVSQARILLLDEPTAGLDLGARVNCVKTIESIQARKNPPTLVIISHHLDEIPKHVDHVVLLKEGQIHAQGTPDDTLTSENLSRVFQCQVSVMKHEGRFLATVLV